MYTERINLMCALAGISKSRLADDLGISKQALGNYIKKKSKFNDIVRTGILYYFKLPAKIFTEDEIHLVLKGNKLTVI